MKVVTMTQIKSTSECPASPLALEPEGVAHPESFYASVRGSAPTFIPEIGAWLLTSSDKIMEVSSDQVQLSHRNPAGPHFAKMLRDSLGRVMGRPGAPANAEAAVTMGRDVLFTADPPNHTRQRRIVAGVFSPAELKVIAVQAKEISHRLIDGFIERGEVEIVGEMAWLLPLEVIARRVGVPVELLTTFRTWAEDLAKMLGGGMLSEDETQRILQSLSAFHAYFNERLDEAAADPKSNILGLLAQNADKLSRQEMLGILTQFMVAGHETTTALISGLVLRLAKDPDLADRLRADRSLIAAFVEEGLRLESPSQGTFRRTKQEVEIEGVKIPAGDYIFLPYAAVNRDPARHANADQMNLERKGEAAHVAFGRGAHFCIGAPRARLEANVAIECILDRLADIRLAGDHPYEYNPSYMVRGLKFLRLSFTASPRAEG